MRENNIHYIIKPEDRKVICIYNCNPYVVVDFLENLNVPYCNKINWNDYKIRGYYAGIATCAPEDEWDENTGKLIALKRATEKYYTIFFSMINKYFNIIDKEINCAIDRCNSLGNKYNRVMNKFENEIQACLKTDFKQS